VIGQFHTPAVSPPGKAIPLQIEKEFGWAPKPVWKLWVERKTLLPLPEVKPRFL
jgi:hypothetical protein